MIIKIYKFPVQTGHAQCGRRPSSGSTGAEPAAGLGTGEPNLDGRAPGLEPSMMRDLGVLSLCY